MLRRNHRLCLPRQRSRRRHRSKQKSAIGYCRHKGFSRSLDSASFDALVLVVSALIQSGQIHLTQSWYFLSYGKESTPKCSLAFNSQSECFKLLESCQLTACRIFKQQLNSRGRPFLDDSSGYEFLLYTLRSLV